LHSSIPRDIAQAFDKVWHPGLLYKIKRLFPTNYYNLLKSYLSDRLFEVKIIEEISSRLPIHSGVPQGSLLSPLLYTLNTHDLPTIRKMTIGTFADDTAIFATLDNPVTASTHLQEHLSLIEAWISKWKIKVYTNNLHPPKRYLPTSTNKSHQHTTKRTGQISRINP
jgi:hypothetical protein